MTAYQDVMAFQRETEALAQIAGRLGWGQEKMMPAGPAHQRGEEMAAIEGVLHARRTDPRVGDWLTRAEAPDAAGARALSLIARAYGRNAAVPAGLASEIARVTSVAQGIWAEARARDDVAHFLPTLERVVFGVGLQVETVPVLDILERVTGDLQMQAKQKNISLGVELPRDLPHAIEANQALLHQALYNLVENAIKYTPEGGAVTVHVDPRPDGSFIFAVQDSGIGISKEDRKRLFEKFYRGTNRDALMQRGTELGLAIVKSIAERRGGKAWVESELGKGSVFFLQIP